MNFIVNTPNGDRVSIEELAGYAVNKIAEGDAGALATLQHARQSQDAAEYQDLAEFIDAMLAAPERAKEITYSVSDAACTRFGMAIALAYSERNPGASVSMVPENEDDRAYLASFQGAPATEAVVPPPRACASAKF